MSKDYKIDLTKLTILDHAIIAISLGGRDLTPELLTALNKVTEYNVLKMGLSEFKDFISQLNQATEAALILEAAEGIIDESTK